MNEASTEDVNILLSMCVSIEARTSKLVEYVSINRRL